MPRKSDVQFPARPRIERSDIGRRRIWRSLCGRYRIDESLPELRGLPSLVYLMIADAWGWRIVSRHRTRGGAENACQRHAAKVAREGKATVNHG